MSLVLAKLVPHPIFGWLGIKRKTAALVETLDDYDSQLLAFADHSKPALSKLANAYYDGGELSPGDARTLLGELRDLRARLENRGMAAWPKDVLGPEVQLTNANVDRFIATCERVCALLDIAIERQASIWIDSD